MRWAGWAVGVFGLGRMLVNLTINGEPRTLTGVVSVADVLRVLDVPLKGVAVERNLEIVPRSQLSDTPVCDNDRLEIVSFVGGG